MSKNVLVVDDAVFMRTMLIDILKEGGYNVVADVGDGIKAVEKYKELFNTEDKIDVVLLDITMPEMDGISALKKIKEFDDDAKVIMCSALKTESSVITAVQLGAKDFIGKPFQRAQVLERVAKVLSK
jgi:two-component system, chemotaxis family, chemotaxis protein CheY